MMDASQIEAGKVYEDRDGLLRYVASVSNTRKRVVWRRPSDSPIFSYTDTMSDFVAAIEAARLPSATDTGETP